jgi:hypothetical protein
MITATVTYEIPDGISAKEFVDVVTDSTTFNAEYVAFRLELKDDVHLSIPVSYQWGDESTLHGIGEGSLELCEIGPDECEHEDYDY